MDDDLKTKDPHKNFKIFHGIVDLVVLIFLGFCLYRLNTTKEFSIFDNIKFTLAYIFVWLAISIVSLFIYGWFKTDVFDDIKEKLQPYVDKYFSFIYFIKKIFKNISPTISTLIACIIFLYLMYLCFIYLISFF